MLRNFLGSFFKTLGRILVYVHYEHPRTQKVLIIELRQDDILSWENKDDSIVIKVSHEKVEAFIESIGFFKTSPTAVVFFYPNKKFVNLAREEHYKDLIYVDDIVITIKNEEHRQLIINCLEGKKPPKQKWWDKILL